MNKLMRDLIGLESVQEKESIKKINSQSSFNKIDAPHDDNSKVKKAPVIRTNHSLSVKTLKFHFISFIILVIWLFIMSLIRGMGIKLGWFAYSLSMLGLYIPYQIIIKKRKNIDNFDKIKSNKNIENKTANKIFTLRNYLILLFILIISFSFYWFEYRPSQIRKKCYIEIKEKAHKHYIPASASDAVMNACLMKYGIK